MLPSAGLFCLFAKRTIFASMNNLPSNLTRHTVFRDNDYSHTLVFPDTYVLPAVEDMAMQVRRNAVIVDDVDAVITKDGQRVTFTYAKEDLALIPGYNFQYFLIDGKSILGGELMVVIGVGEQDVTETQVIIEDGNVTTVVVQGLDLVAELTEIAVEAAAKVANKIPSLSVAQLQASLIPDFSTVAISDQLKSGTFFLRNGTSLAIDGAMVIQDASGNKWERQVDNSINAAWFGADPVGVVDSTAALNAAAAIAKTLGKGVQVDKGTYLVNGTVTFWTDVDASSQSEFVLAAGTGSIVFNPTTPFTTLTSTDITGLTKGSRACNIVNRKDQTILLRSSSEILINRYDSGPRTPYYKRQLIRLTDNVGTFNSELQQTYSDLSALTVRAYVTERPITVNNLKIRIPTIATMQTPLTINRGDMVFNDLWVINEGDSRKGSIAVALNTAYNVEFNTPVISGFTDEDNPSRLGYGIQMTDVYDVRINDPHITNCKHTIMGGYGTKCRVKRGILEGVDDEGTGLANLQPVDVHWFVDFEVDGSEIHSKYGSVHAFCGAGKDIIIKNCRIYNCWSVGGMSATTPEIDGYWIAEKNHIKFTEGASHMYILGAFSSGVDYGTEFQRMVLHPKYIRIAHNTWENPNTTNFLFYRGITSIFPNGRSVTERIEIEGNYAISGQNAWTLATSQLLQVREENVMTVGKNPQIVINNQDFEKRDYDNTTPAVRIYSRLKASMTNPYGYELTVNGPGRSGYSFEVDIDACNRAVVNGVDIVSLNGAQTLVGGETKTPSFFWELQGCSIGKYLPTGKTSAYLNVGSPRVTMTGCTVYSDFRLRSGANGSKGPDNISNFDDGVISAEGNYVVKGTQKDVDGGSTVVVPPFKTHGWVNPTYFEMTADTAVYNYATLFPTITDVLTNKAKIARFNDNSFGLYANFNGTLFDLLSPRIGTSITSTSNITPLRGLNSFSASSATPVTGTIQTSNYVSAGSTILFFRNVGVGDVTIAIAGGVTLTGAPFTLTTNDELVLISTGANTYRILHLKQKAILSEIQTGTENSKHITSKGLSDYFANLSVFADNAAATTGGVPVGKAYRTATGEIRIRV